MDGIPGVTGYGSGHLTATAPATCGLHVSFHDGTGCYLDGETVPPGETRVIAEQGSYSQVALAVPQENGTLVNAAVAQVNRDELWRESPALEQGCEHDRELLPVIEFRQSVICRNCGGLDKDLSRRIQRDALRLLFDSDGIVRDGTVRLARWKPAQA